jgi:hypothetical protein
MIMMMTMSMMMMITTAMMMTTTMIMTTLTIDGNDNDDDDDENDSVDELNWIEFQNKVAGGDYGKHLQATQDLLEQHSLQEAQLQALTRRVRRLNSKAQDPQSSNSLNSRLAALNADLDKWVGWFGPASCYHVWFHGCWECNERNSRRKGLETLNKTKKKLTIFMDAISKISYSEINSVYFVSVIFDGLIIDCNFNIYW